ncbi:MAG: SAM-dependent methyltransferase [Chloroflexota bacterium]|nr:SAM-dependent methyltransferase [Chloroflexota bacterium]
MSDLAPTPLIGIIRDRIGAAGGRIPFAEYMDLALYDPDYGYYSAGVVALGRGGDFTTSPEVDPAFGAALAVFARRCDAALDHPPRFLLAEHGAGSGRLMADLLTALRAADPGLYTRLDAVVVERSPALQARQAATLAAAGHAARMRWAAATTGAGLVFSNELLDAFAVHRVVHTAAGWVEIYVALAADGRFVEERGPLSDPALAAYFADLDLLPPLDQPCEVNLAAPAWLRGVAAGLERGFVLTIDYGDTAARLYSALRPAGTLLCYSGGRVTDDFYSAPGAQDMTAHVDFTTLERTGQAGGLETVAITRQMAFLVGLGLGEALAAVGATPTADRAAYEAALAQRTRLFRLIDPDALGRFHVLVQAKGVPRARWPAITVLG